MKLIILFSMLVGFQSAAYAGWGAIAYSPSTGHSSEAHGYNSYDSAVNAALLACGASCSIVNWEHDRCNALATGNGHKGEAHGYSTSQEAIDQAINWCGAGCVTREWICN